MRTRVWVIGLFLLALSCRSGEAPPGKPVISVSIIPQQYFLEQLAGDLVEINVMIPPGASPATYEPSLSQLGRLDRSVLYFKMGYLGFEQSWMDKISGTNPKMKVVDLSEGVTPIRGTPEEDAHQQGHVHQGTDPHIWMSTMNGKIIAHNMLKELLLLFPEQEATLEGRFKQFSLMLDSLHREISVRLEDLENRKFMIYHPALTYYAREFGLEQIPLEIEGKTPSPSHLKEMTDLAIRNQVTRIFIQKQFDRKNAEILAGETGARIIQFDPLDIHWGAQMRYIAEQLNPDGP